MQCDSRVNEGDLLERPAHRPHFGRGLLKGELVRVRSGRGGRVTLAAVLRHGRHDDGNEYDAASHHTCSNLEASPVCSKLRLLHLRTNFYLSYLRRIPSYINLISFTTILVERVVVHQCRSRSKNNNTRPLDRLFVVCAMRSHVTDSGTDDCNCLSGVRTTRTRRGINLAVPLQ